MSRALNCEASKYFQFSFAFSLIGEASDLNLAFRLGLQRPLQNTCMKMGEVMD